jgi:hypothetical protein
MVYLYMNYDKHDRRYTFERSGRCYWREKIWLDMFFFSFFAFLHIRLVWFSALGFELFSFFCMIYWKSVYC